MTVRDIIKKYLEENGFDGLFNPGMCACKTGDLMPCECFTETDNCEPDYLQPCDGDNRNMDGWDFHIGPKKIEQTDAVDLSDKAPPSP